jgi:hypothetical protein
MGSSASKGKKKEERHEENDGDGLNLFSDNEDHEPIEDTDHKGILGFMNELMFYCPMANADKKNSLLVW